MFNLKKNYRHFYHLVDPSPWPVYVAISCFLLTVGFVVWTYYGISLLMVLGLFSVVSGMYFWFRDVIDESTYLGFHTKVVRRSLRMGMVLFIVSEVFFFISFFWAFFHSSLAPSIQIGSLWPPRGLKSVVFKALEIPLLNTIILLSSGASITWAHYAIVGKNRKDTIISFIITIVLAIFFTILQIREYMEARFSFSSGVYGSVFFIATGFHGLHVLIGSIFIIVCFIRFLNYEFTKKHHEGFLFASWYWHFVDVVWLFLYFVVYIWGNL
jgi:heme/copper-type cytochrome/quinol oxidase subunit 3